MRRNKGSGKKKMTDSDDAPTLTREFFRSADVYKGEKLLRRGRPPAGERLKEAVKLRISPDARPLSGRRARMANAHQRRARTCGVAGKEEEQSRHNPKFGSESIRMIERGAGRAAWRRLSQLPVVKSYGPS
jgi:hypothetical protein